MLHQHIWAEVPHLTGYARLRLWQLTARGLHAPGAWACGSGLRMQAGTYAGVGDEAVSRAEGVDAVCTEEVAVLRAGAQGQGCRL